MNEYYIEHGIKTLSELYEPFTFHEFKFEQWDTRLGAPCGRAWRVSKTVNAETFREAFSQFYFGLFPLVNRIAFVSQCFMMIELHGEGIRNSLLHGMKPDLDNDKYADVDYISDIYKSILRYFRETHAVEIETNIVNPQRTPYENYQLWHCWLKPTNRNAVPDLRSAQEALSAYVAENRAIVGFEQLDDQSASY
jgi:hypothetical protein